MGQIRRTFGVVVIVTALGGACSAGSDSGPDTQAATAEAGHEPERAGQNEDASTAQALTAIVAGRSDVTIAVNDLAVDVTVVTPERWTPGDETPVLLAIPPGEQSQAMVEAGLDRYWATEGPGRGWVVVSPVAADATFYREGATVLAPLLDALAPVIVAEEDRVHVAGPSNGGLSAFRFALDHPDRVTSVIGLPGYPPGGESETIEPLTDVPVALFVGENDTGWREPMEDFAARFDEAGGSVTLTVSPGEGHVLERVAPETLFDLLDDAR